MTTTVRVTALNKKVSMSRIDKKTGNVELKLDLEPGETAEMTTWLSNHVLVSEFEDELEVEDGEDFDPE